VENIRCDGIATGHGDASKNVGTRNFFFPLPDFAGRIIFTPHQIRAATQALAVDAHQSSP
jgi:hypothetical protein